MSTNGGDSVFPQSKPQLTGAKAVLQYTGIPPSWLDKRPKLPSRNWLIFLSLTSAITGYYFYDRRQCRKIREEYAERVKHLSMLPLHSMDFPRKVTVYGCKWPADQEYDRSIKYFRKYVKVRPTRL
jgi:mitochondrial import inner membrane translocase subunit TIM54